MVFKLLSRNPKAPAFMGGMKPIFKQASQTEYNKKLYFLHFGKKKACHKQTGRLLNI